MQFLLLIMILVFFVSDMFNLDFSLGPGVSVKNAMLSLLALALAIRFLLSSEKLKLQLPDLLGAFIFLFAYALLTFVIVGAFIKYPNYNVLASAAQLKGSIVDPALLVGLFVYGVNSDREAETFIKTLAGGLAIANGISIGNAFGLFHIGVNVIGDAGDEAGRVFGSFGHANETAALIVCFLPIYVAATISSKGLARTTWIAAGIVSISMLVLTGSRGAFLGLIVGGALATILCRAYLPIRRVVSWVAIGLAIALPILVIVEIKFGGVFLSRISELLLEPGQRGGDRTAIWLPPINRMMDSPLSLITGFGWNAYSAMGFYFAAHNHYLLLWFELGLAGLAAYLAIIWRVLSTALAGVKRASTDPTNYLLAFVFGMVMLSVAIFFTLLSHPWPYIWAYVGLVMRLAINVTGEPRNVSAWAPSEGRRS